MSLEIKNHLVHFPIDMMSMQVRQQQNKKFKTGLIELYSCQKTVIPPHQIMIPFHCSSDITHTTGTVENTPAFMRKTCRLVSPGITDLTDRKTMIQVTNPNENIFTIEANRNIAFLEFQPSRSSKHNSNSTRTSQNNF